ncbi:RNA methyltransferase [Microbacterium kribbense]|uniref:RNA methyltransferase n=1 Tax=Microbacterium kribbense TaxID=433645 RepID=A0ABP7GNP6_9MICO
MTRIDDPADPRLSDYRDLTDVALRRKLEPAGGLYMAESAKVLVRALAVGHLPRSVLLQEKWMPEAEQLLVSHPDVPVYVVPAEVAEQVTGYAVHRGLLAAMHRPQLPPVADVVAGARRVAVFEDVVDHTNVGAAFRSAAALGVDAVLVTPRCADPLYRRSVRVSMGTVFQVPWTRIQGWPEGIDELQDAGFVVAGMTLGEGAISLDELVAQRHAKLALVFGTEGHGLTAKADRRVDRRVTIPMTGGVDSLNIAAASAVAFYATR